MKKILIITIILFTNILTGQIIPKSIQNVGDKLIINDTISLERGKTIQVFLPLRKDFMFIKPVKKINTKLLGSVASITGSGAAAIGIGSGNIKVLSESMKIMRAANAIEYGTEALEKIQELPISNEAKKIAGKKFEIVNWEFSDSGYVLLTKYEKKEYKIYLQEALLAGEIKLY